MALVDLRWQRTFNLNPASPFMGTQQVQQLAEALESWEALDGVDRVAVFSAIPFMYQGTFPAEFADWVENEKYSTVNIHHAETLAVLRSIRDKFSGDKLLFAGDLHMAYDSRICFAGDAGDGCIRQLITSGLTEAAATLKAVRRVLG